MGSGAPRPRAPFSAQQPQQGVSKVAAQMLWWQSRQGYAVRRDSKKLMFAFALSQWVARGGEGGRMNCAKVLTTRSSRKTVVHVLKLGQGQSCNNDAGTNCSYCTQSLYFKVTPCYTQTVL